MKFFARGAFVTTFLCGLGVGEPNSQILLRPRGLREEQLQQPSESAPPEPAPSSFRGRSRAANVQALKLPLLATSTVVFVVLFAFCYSTKNRGSAVFGEDEADKDTVLLPYDTYGFVVASLIRDWSKIREGSSIKALRIWRMSYSVSIALLSVCFQLFLMYLIKRFVTAKWVHDIRVDYDQFQMHMYGHEPGHTVLTVNGYHRGVDKYFQPGNFLSLNEGLKGRVCNVPFSQPAFFLMVLFLWTLTCISEFRISLSLAKNLVFDMPTVDCMTKSVVQGDVFYEEKKKVVIVAGLTSPLKALLAVIVIIPRLLVTCVLLWLGSRFLAATNDFCEMVLNTIALEFVILFKDLLWNTVIPERNKKETMGTELNPSSRSEPATYWSYSNSFLWLLLGFGYTVFYMLFFQGVLPDYNWDVAAVCTSWLEDALEV